MTEVLFGHDLVRSPLDPEKVSENSLKNGAPRSEFFLMTGDKMINLNHKISPRYAEVFIDVQVTSKWLYKNLLQGIY